MTDTLPPVVSNPEVCSIRSFDESRGWYSSLPHDWFKRWGNNALGALVGRGWKEYKVCRFCGGRKPDDLG